MKAKQLYYLLVVTCVVMFGALFAVGYAANRLLGQQADKLSKLRGDSQAADSQQASLIKDKQDITKYSELNTIAESVVPQDKDQAQAVQQIVNIAANSGIPDLSSITFPASTLGTKASGVGTSTNSGLTQLTPVAGIGGVYTLQITITQSSTNSVPYSDFLSFLTGLEQNRRTAQVTSITVTPDTTHQDNVSFTLVLNEFLKP